MRLVEAKLISREEKLQLFQLWLKRGKITSHTSTHVLLIFNLAPRKGLTNTLLRNIHSDPQLIMAIDAPWRTDQELGELLQCTLALTTPQ